MFAAHNVCALDVITMKNIIKVSLQRLSILIDYIYKAVIKSCNSLQTIQAKDAIARNLIVKKDIVSV